MPSPAWLSESLLAELRRQRDAAQSMTVEDLGDGIILIDGGVDLPAVAEVVWAEIERRANAITEVRYPIFGKNGNRIASSTFYPTHGLMPALLDALGADA